MARAGRPPKGAEAGPRRTVRRTTRLTPGQAAKLDLRAAREGMTVSDYIRGMIFSDLMTPVEDCELWDERVGFMSPDEMNQAALDAVPLPTDETGISSDKVGTEDP